MRISDWSSDVCSSDLIENPHDSALFQQFPGVLANETAITFMCDYLRMMTLGSNDPHEMETLMDEEIEVVHHEHSEVAHALQIMADGMPALGIVDAVLGVLRSDKHTSELQSLMRTSYADFCVK